MARTYVSSYKYNFLNLFGLPEAGSPNPHVNTLVGIWQDVISTLQSNINLSQPAEWSVNRKEFVIDAVIDSFEMFRRYGYTATLSQPMVDEKTQFIYHTLTVTSDNATDNDDNQEWTLEDVGTEVFTVMFEGLVGMSPVGIPNAKVWQMFQKFTAMQDTIESMRKNKSSGKSITAYLVFSTGMKVNDWMLKVIDDNAENVCHNFKAHLLPGATAKG